MSELALTLPDELVEAVALRVVAILEERGIATQDRANEWLRGADEIAEAFAWPRSRVYDLSSRREATGCPIVNDGARLTARRSELEAWLRNGGGS